MALEPNFVPSKLMETCRAVVRLAIQTTGMRDLPRRVASADYMVAAAQFSDTFAVMKTITFFFRMGIASAIGAVVFALLAVFLKWWCLFGTIALIGVAFWTSKSVRAGYMYLTAIFLGLEVIATDFCGWGTAYPELKQRALETLNDDVARPKTTWLDFYLPGRANFSDDSIRSFGPAG